MKTNQPYKKLRQFFKRRSVKTGMLPGTPVYVGSTQPSPTSIAYFQYNADSFVEKQNVSLADLPDPKEGQVLWIQVDGLQNIELLKTLGERFKIHPLTIEDMLNTQQRPKIEDFDEVIYVVLKMLYPNGHEENNHHMPVSKIEQVSLILGKGVVISCLEDPGDVFDSVRQQIRENKGKVRKRDSDFLLYALMDVIVDQYFVVIEQLGEVLEQLEDKVMENPEPNTLQRIHNLRQETIFLRRCIWPLREILNHLLRSDGSALVNHESFLYFRDIYDHTIQIIDHVETNRDILSSMIELYLSSVSYQLNVVMKVLTIIATIFIPLTFITSIYGMNFEFMPELHWQYGYEMVWGIMILVAIGMLSYFKRKDWL